jgi:ketosteroid isomerase-like protein
MMGHMHAVSSSAISSLVAAALALGLGLGLGAGCGGSSPPAAATPPTAPAAGEAPAADYATSAADLSPALAPLRWWLGAWDAQDGKAREHWIANDGALYGVALDAKGGFEVMIVDDGEDGKPADGALRFHAMPGGGLPVAFALKELTSEGAVFENPAHDFPQVVRYARQGDVLGAEISGGGTPISYGFALAATPPRALELEAADLAFAADTDQRGVDGWVAAFEPAGWMHSGGEKRVGPDAIRAAMADFLGEVKIAWKPVASARRGDLGFTLGEATFTHAKASRTWKGTYVTLWHRQPDGSWKVRFDTGRTVNESFAK